MKHTEPHNSCNKIKEFTNKGVMKRPLFFQGCHDENHNTDETTEKFSFIIQASETLIN
jgi:hypothetical protein